VTLSQEVDALIDAMQVAVDKSKAMRARHAAARAERDADLLVEYGDDQRTDQAADTRG
jgi:hypothetical protein